MGPHLEVEIPHMLILGQNIHVFVLLTISERATWVHDFKHIFGRAFIFYM